jgi:hypothetical protein
MNNQNPGNLCPSSGFSFPGSEFLKKEVGDSRYSQGHAVSDTSGRIRGRAFRALQHHVCKDGMADEKKLFKSVSTQIYRRN